MKLSLSLTLVFLVTTVATARPVLDGGDLRSIGGPSGRPHPAVVRVVVPDRVGFSFGSGALVAVRGGHGLVVTNWHVVREAAGQIVVVFPDGFRSDAIVLGTDRDWDLAALAIERPHVAPIPVATQAPRPGEPLTIAGYGSGQYREITGRCTQYVAPGRNQPFEMVELSAGARQGDSGGPILNSRGELAGVLFGAAWGQTTGSYCGRVRWFLDSMTGQFDRLESRGTMLAQRSGANPAGRDALSQAPAVRRADPGPVPRGPRPQPQWPLDAGSRTSPRMRGQETLAQRAAPGTIARGAQSPRAGAGGRVLSPLPTVSIPAPPRSTGESVPAEAAAPNSGTAGVAPRSEPPRVVAQTQPGDPLRWEDVAGTTLSEQIKTILAGVGVLAIVLHGLRLLSKAYDS